MCVEASWGTQKEKEQEEREVQVRIKERECVCVEIVYSGKKRGRAVELEL
jgi:hypothetical protein